MNGVSDPGGETIGSPVGTEGWAKRVRLELQSIVDDLPKAASRAEGYFKLIQEHRAWILMNKKDGSKFETFDEFCAAERPWGLGKPYSEIKPHLEAIHGKRTVELMAVPPAKVPPPPPPHIGPGRGHREETVPAFDAGTVSEPQTPSNRRDQQLRAVLRAPEPVQQLYREGLIAQTVAAKFGPAAPTPEQAGQLAEVAQRLVAEARTQPVTTPAEQRQVQRQVNAQARESLGLSQDPVDRLVRAYTRLDASGRRRFRRLIDRIDN